VRRRVLLLLLLAALAGCDRAGPNMNGPDLNGPAASSENGLSLTAGFAEPLRSGHAVTWVLKVENRGPAAVTLRFSSGKDGDVALLQSGREVYRWSANRLFSQAIRQVPLEPGDSRSFKLQERTLGVAAGDYDLVAGLAADPSPGAVRRPVTVR
jgi:Intracellular proteinase inhibitor